MRIPLPVRRTKASALHIGRLPYEADLLVTLTGYCIRNKIRSGYLSAIGAVSSARVGYYDQRKKQYRSHVYRKRLEIASCTGVISIIDGGAPPAGAGGSFHYATSPRFVRTPPARAQGVLRGGKPMVHAHIVLTDSRGRAFGGHLMEGTTVFAGEFVIIAAAGSPLVRGYDETTGLYLWQR